MGLDQTILAIDSQGDGTVTRDPVCGMLVGPSNSELCTEFEGTAYLFCSNGCRNRFQSSPETYIKSDDPVCGMKVERSVADFMSGF